MALDPGSLLLRHQLADCAPEPLRNLVEAVVLPDPSLGLHHLGERPEADALPVRQRASLSPVGEGAAAFDRAEELVDKSALADAGSADERDQLGRALVLDPLERRYEHVELPIAADQRSGTVLAD